MATLEEIAAKNKRLNLAPDAGMIRRGVERGARAMWYAPSQIAAIPARGAKNMLEGMMFGPKNANPLSPAFGKRLGAVGGDKGYSQITKAEYEAIKSGDKAGKAITAKTGPGGAAYFKKQFRPGGLVGFAQKHPLLAGGGALLAYYLANNAGARQATGRVAAGLKPNFQTAPTEGVKKQWANPSFQNPLANEVWGK